MLSGGTGSAFGQPDGEQRERQKNYVFVDEHNRHRRLKVMRACEGCRRRKIKCDAATTNTWPCASCVRLKLSCLPPTLSFDGSDATNHTNQSSNDIYTVPFANVNLGNFVNNNNNSSNSSNNNNNYQYNQTPAGQPYYPPPPSPPQSNDSYHLAIATPSVTAQQMRTQSFTPMSQGMDDFHYSTLKTSTNPVDGRYYGSVLRDPSTDPATSPAFDDFQYSTLKSSTSPTVERYLRTIYSEPSTDRATVARTENSRTPDHDGDLSQALQDLKISEAGLAPYMTSLTFAESHPIQEVEYPLPKEVINVPHPIIPAEMMPADHLAMQYFQYYFANIHPFVPVINSTDFYKQWRVNPKQISPLILEGIFACASQTMSTSVKGSQWLALAARHEESFKDVPRLSTLQGLLILLKARETVPKQGYYYRSWMTVVNMIAMAKDLELDLHHNLHRDGHSCESSPSDCAVKTRVWHVLFVVELMIGGPQGRMNFAVPLQSIDYEPPARSAILDDAEWFVSRRFAYFLRCIKNVRETCIIYAALRSQKMDWAHDPTFIKHNVDFDEWLERLPQDMQIAYPSDKSAPWINDHFLANLHSYYYLGVVMHYRPQLKSTETGLDENWKHVMHVSYRAATTICRLQEAVIQANGLAGLLCMQRGVNFAIYSILTCTMLHLVALTSPEPDLNLDAADFFTRHMRILEQCSSAWPVVEIQAQIDSLRQAFSADMSKPFELRADYRRIAPNNEESSPRSDPGYTTESDYTQSTHMGMPITPPAGVMNHIPRRTESVAMHASIMTDSGRDRHNNVIEGMQMSQQPSFWNPIPIINQWDMAFGGPAAPQAAPQSSPPAPVASLAISQSQNPSSYTDYSTTSNNLTAQSYSQQQIYPRVQVPQFQTPAATPSEGQVQQSQQVFIQQQAPYPSYVTPSMWQEVVGESLKRRHVGGGPGIQKSSRRR